MPTTTVRLRLRHAPSCSSRVVDDAVSGGTGAAVVLAPTAHSPVTGLAMVGSLGRERWLGEVYPEAAR